MVVELIGGFLTNSIALLSDAGHMFTHSFAITISIIAILIAKRPPCHHKTFGLYRAEILAAFINGIFLLVVVAIIIYEALLRLFSPLEVLGFEMLIIALIGLAVNGISILILHGSHKTNLNIKGVFYHMVGDAVSSIGIVFGGIIIIFTGWNIIDPLISFGISALIIIWAYNILKESARILLEIAPKGLDVNIISKNLKQKFPEITELYNSHLWTITSDMIVFSTHITIDETKQINQTEFIQQINTHLTNTFHIIESTIQIIPSYNTPTCNTSK
jgi:cobalt-zinc-cadmium efflux system protein